MNTRRHFIESSSLLSVLFFSSKDKFFNLFSGKKYNMISANKNKNVIISTWKHGLPANEAAWKTLQGGGSVLDAVEQGIHVPELDPAVNNVGYGGLPDRDGYVTLDACIIDEKGNCGSVAFLQHIKTPISVARLVMEKTPHVMLTGDGALQFALDNGFKKENLLTDESKAAWELWLKDNNYTPKNFENHDTIGLLAMDAKGTLCGGCSTDGLAWKMHGRVGDSPIIGDGLFVDNEVGGACATGVGEAVMKLCGSHLIVELMRQGKSPQQACEEAVDRIIKREANGSTVQVGFLAMNKDGDTGAFSIQKGFQYARCIDGDNQLLDSQSRLN